MTARPWFPLYCADYLADTAHLTTTQSGAYLHLLMCMWLAGGTLPNDEKKLARCARVSLWIWRERIAAEIMPLLTITDEGVTQKRLQLEIGKSRAISMVRSAATSLRSSTPSELGSSAWSRRNRLRNNDRPPAKAYTTTITVEKNKSDASPLPCMGGASASRETQRAPDLDERPKGIREEQASSSALNNSLARLGGSIKKRNGST